MRNEKYCLVIGREPIEPAIPSNRLCLAVSGFSPDFPYVGLVLHVRRTIRRVT